MSTSTDTIIVSDLRVDAVVGVWEWERRITQQVSIDLELATDIRRAAETDSIDDTLDYRAVAKRVSGFVAESRYQLIESMAEGITEVIMTEFSVPWVRIVVRKPGAVRGSRDVGVCIERGERG
jgi:dihydroneopterin aldolase